MATSPPTRPKQIASWVSADQTKKGDGFEGCEYGKYILFSDGTYLVCRGYGYQYAYGATVMLLVNGSLIKMIVGDSVYDMGR
jgi:hypothetical protein